MDLAYVEVTNFQYSKIAMILHDKKKRVANFQEPTHN